MNISLKSASRSLTVVASLLCLGGVLSFLKSEENMKPLALNIIIASGTVAVTTQIASKIHEESANNQMKDYIVKSDKEWKKLNAEHQRQSQALKETQVFRDELQQDFAKATDEIIWKNQTIEILEGKVKQLVTSFEIKTQ